MRERSLDSRSPDASITGINVTPFVDVALVLLVIFMVTATHLAQPQGIPVDLPHESPGAVARAPLSVSIDATGAVFVDARPVSERELQGQARRRHAADQDVRAIVVADPRVSHGSVVRVIDLIRQAGVTRFAMQSPSG